MVQSQVCRGPGSGAGSPWGRGWGEGACGQGSVSRFRLWASTNPDTGGNKRRSFCRVKGARLTPGNGTGTSFCSHSVWGGLTINEEGKQDVRGGWWQVQRRQQRRGWWQRKQWRGRGRPGRGSRKTGGGGPGQEGEPVLLRKEQDEAESQEAARTARLRRQLAPAALLRAP